MNESPRAARDRRSSATGWLVGIVLAIALLAALAFVPMFSCPFFLCRMAQATPGIGSSGGVLASDCPACHGRGKVNFLTYWEYRDGFAKNF